MINPIPTKSSPWSEAQFAAAITAAQQHTHGRAIVQMALLEYALTDDPLRAADLAERLASGPRTAEKAAQKVASLLDAHRQLEPPPAPPTPQVPRRARERRQVPGHPGGYEPERRTTEDRGLVAPWEKRTKTKPAPATPAASSPLPPFRNPPLTPDEGSIAGRLSLRRWAELGLIRNPLNPAPATISAVYTRLFGVSPPRATDRRAACGYTQRELTVVLRALSDHRQS